MLASSPIIRIIITFHDVNRRLWIFIGSRCSQIIHESSEYPHSKSHWKERERETRQKAYTCRHKFLKNLKVMVYQMKTEGQPYSIWWILYQRYNFDEGTWNQLCGPLSPFNYILQCKYDSSLFRSLIPANK